MTDISRIYLLDLPPGPVLRIQTVQPRSGRPAGVALVLHGRSEFLEKYWETICDLTSRGYGVVTLDWRGQGLSGRETPNRHKGYVQSFDDYVADLESVYDRFVKPLDLPVTIVAHSMGAHVALRFMHDYPGLVSRAVLVSSMVEILTPFPGPLLPVLSRTACSAGLAKAYVPGETDYRSRDVRFKGNVVTHDSFRFLAEERAILKNPDLAVGGVTWGWFRAALESMALLLGPGYVCAITTPCLMIGADQDRVVSLKAQERVAAMIPRCRFVVIPGACHEVLHETDAIRAQFWTTFDQFAVQGQQVPLPLA
ncbi:MAG: alpha/beta hydrolase [Pseudomonadota bacterium]